MAFRVTAKHVFFLAVLYFISFVLLSEWKNPFLKEVMFQRRMWIPGRERFAPQPSGKKTNLREESRPQSTGKDRNQIGRDYLIPPSPVKGYESTSASRPGTNPIFKLWDKDTFDFVTADDFKDSDKRHDDSKTGDMGHTSYNMTSVKLVSPKLRHIHVGDVLQFRIQSRDFNGRDRIVGGDMWYAVLSSYKRPNTTTAGYIADYENGTYDVFVLAAWPGEARLNLRLVHASEACYHLRHVVWNDDEREVWTGEYKSGPRNASSKCALRGHGAWKGKCEYRFPRSLGSTVFVCDRIPGFPCNTFQTYQFTHTHSVQRALQLTKGVEYLFKWPYYSVEVPVKYNKMKIKGSDLPEQNLTRCHPDQPIPAIQGYWKDGKWTSLLCSFSDWLTKARLRSCLRNKHLVLIGDSTTRQWWEELLHILGKPDNLTLAPTAFKILTKSVYKSFDLRMDFHFHAFPIMGKTANLDEPRDAAYILEEFGVGESECDDLVLVLSPWAHFTYWSRVTYVERARHLRAAVLRLRARCPRVPIVVKGPHLRHHINYNEIVHASDYLVREIGRINQDAFAGTGALFLPVWDMNLAYPRPGGPNIHMPVEVVREELKIFLGYVCDNLKWRQKDRTR